jgi:uncharacterized protein (TIGR03067 family)
MLKLPEQKPERLLVKGRGSMKIQIIKLLLSLMTLGVLLSGCSSYTKLEGRWEGCNLRKPLIDWTLTINGNRFYLAREDLTVWYAGRFRLNNNCLIKKIDLQFSDTNIEARGETTLLGIYEVDENTLTLITAAPGKNFRPLSFDETQGTVIFSFVRS